MRVPRRQRETEGSPQILAAMSGIMVPQRGFVIIYIPHLSSGLRGLPEMTSCTLFCIRALQEIEFPIGGVAER